MKLLVTGARGFIGRNLTAQLLERGCEVLPYDLDSDSASLDALARECGFVFHLAGVNRPQDPAEFMSGNCGFTGELLAALERHGNKAPVVVSSSIQAALDNPYGVSKKAGEELLAEHGRRTGAPVWVYRLPNVFGKWCRPNYNSAVATFCHNNACGEPVTVNDPEVVMNLVYIDDVVAEFIRCMEQGGPGEGEQPRVEPVHTVKLGRIAELIFSFRQSRADFSVPDLGDPFTRKLYATYLSYLPEEDFAYPLRMNVDQRGSFTEFLRTPDRGQVSVNISKPGITKGNHWHHTKNEKFLVVSGRGVIRFRAPGSERVTEYFVSGERLEAVDIPPGYTHNIENLGQNDLVTVMWASEAFDRAAPDTFFLEV